MDSMKTMINYPPVRGSLAIIWTIILTVLLLQPENQPIIPTGVQPAPPSLQREILFSTMHLLTFAITAWIWCFALNMSTDSKLKLAIILVSLLAYGLSVEYLQTGVPGRTAQWWDMLANCIGIMTGCSIWLWFQKQIETQQYQVIQQISG